MSKKVIIVGDPGIDGAFAATLAMHCPKIELIGFLPTAGNVGAEQATINTHLIVEYNDPEKWPRIGAALPVRYESDGTRLHGSNGLGGVEIPFARLHHLYPADKVLYELIRENKHETTLILMGPCTLFAKVLERDPEVGKLLDKLIVLGGTWHEPGNAGPVVEFHFHCDAPAARTVLGCGAPVFLLPLDATRRLVFSPSELLQLPSQKSIISKFLRKIVSFGIGATASLYGIEGFHLKDVLGLFPVLAPELLKTRPVAVDVETSGELTKGMSVVDVRWGAKNGKVVEMVVDLDEEPIREIIHSLLGNI